MRNFFERAHVERHESKKEQLVRQRLLHGEVGVALEEYLRDSEDLDQDPSRLEEQFEKEVDWDRCSPEFQSFARAVIVDFTERCRAIHDTLPKLRAHLEKKSTNEYNRRQERLKELEDPDYIKSIKLIGYGFFKKEFGEEVADRHLEKRRAEAEASHPADLKKAQEEAVLPRRHFEDLTDEEIFREVINEDAGYFPTADSVSIKHGFVYATGLKINKLTLAPCGGFYRKNHKLLDDVTVPFIYVQKDSPFTNLSESTFVHEEQHYINDMLFKALGNEPSSDDTLVWVDRYMRDELLAFFKDGHDPEVIGDNLKTFYAKQFNLTQHGREIFNPQIDDAISALKDLMSVTPDDDRSKIIYAIADIPLKKIPKWVQEIINVQKKDIPKLRKAS